MSTFFSSPRYYDAPDGEAPFDKIICLAKRGFGAGLYAGTLDCVYHTDTKNAVQTANCLAFWIVPLVGMGATYATVTFMATNLRQKDDPWNHVIGGAACGPILRAWWKSTNVTVWGTLALMALGAAYKYKEEKGLKFKPDNLRHNYGHYMYDMTLMKDVDKGWKPDYSKAPV